MTDQEKLNKMTQILRKYQGAETVFMRPAEETGQQQQFREDLSAVTAVLFREELHALSVEEIKRRAQQIWQETKPEGWKE